MEGEHNHKVSWLLWGKHNALQTSDKHHKYHDMKNFQIKHMPVYVQIPKVYDSQNLASQWCSPNI